MATTPCLLPTSDSFLISNFVATSLRKQIGSQAMRGLARSSFQGLRPVDPEEKQDEHARRVDQIPGAAGDKLLISKAATKGTTVSELLRRAGRAAASGPCCPI